MKKNLMTIMSIILVAITLVGVIAVVVVTKLSDPTSAEDKPSIDEIVKSSVEIPEITTNLAGNDYIKISFMVQTENKKAKEELEKRNFQVKNIIITELSEMKAEELTGKKGKEKLQEALKTRMNELMEEGKVEKVYITSSILQ
ncbi:flagellar basal body-associated protein FliL [Peribacillus simplex]|uniref:Flagellar protein FliL n=1 Tax=Peribacillus simplex NBRC 15720 = DSM 1321 TaxID=1349754 RepID=A0A223ED92_9BACI|nr:flagellar basal body-associated protein FliL [Peribacillus simplex]ASS93222.1 flagellar basal body-associated protein FliL [Peribacillus simplex NBRC 15720 = DSM 1321]MEC1399734.1 flagellar basal body-associated protein FliL [Peribacillus simplex]MED3909368.1 flagellar basal body-associated protein FliL [Peribacillus simplex]MED3982808.1 flagellar basal body-associated protein FliL [Peribacillus simplex]MED4096137.1 flagellar basal body-associated protein FliL [Peribacillus simplex]